MKSSVFFVIKCCVLDSNFNAFVLNFTLFSVKVLHFQLVEHF